MTTAPLQLSCAFAPSPATPDHVARAERLGYHRAWVYDSPALYADVWMTLAGAAQRTSTIGLGPGVLVPSLRHPMANAAAVATLAALAPGRVAVAVGAGFTGRMALGQRGLPWVQVAAYVGALRALLRGDEVEWDGAAIGMLHPPGFAPDRPVDVPVLIGADGPKGLAVARELGDGVMSASPQSGFAWSALLAFGTVLDPGEDAGSARALAAAGHAASVALHARYERGGRFDRIPGGLEWQAATDALPERTRHLALHDQHLVGVPERDRRVVSGDLVRRSSLTGTVDELRDRVAELAAAGVTELVYQPAGPDIPRELERFQEVLPG